jgi:alpha-D-ribose 1-methylphosphonate 5-triphosphate synthase subunit PhnI
VPALSVAQVEQQLGLAVDRVMTEGSLYDRELAALAIVQARGDLVEAIFLLRAYRATLPRLGVSRPLDTARMLIRRRISATFKDLPGGQILGPTFDYTHRLLDFDLASSERRAGEAPRSRPRPPVRARTATPRDRRPNSRRRSPPGWRCRGSSTCSTRRD